MLKSVWRSISLPVSLEMSNMVSRGLLWGFMGLTPTVIKGFYGMSWLACLAG
jgi:Mg2+ and Co2+ transporter CorA